MIRIKILILLSLLLVTIEINAQNNSIWTDSKQINAIQVMNNGGFIIILDSEESTECSKDDENVIAFSPNQNEVSVTGAKSLLSTALISFTTDQKVKIQYSYSIVSDYCWGNALYLTK